MTRWVKVRLPDIPYEVSEDGQVRSVDRTVEHKDGKVTTHKSRVLRQTTNKKGYKVVYPTHKGKKYSLVVHRLVAKAFCTQGEGQDQVNHIDEDKTNNHYTNLEWCDTAYNVEYSQAGVGSFLSPTGELHEVKNFSKFARENGLCNGKLSDLKNGKRKSHKGWTYFETK